MACKTFFRISCIDFAVLTFMSFVISCVSVRACWWIAVNLWTHACVSVWCMCRVTCSLEIYKWQIYHQNICGVALCPVYCRCFTAVFIWFKCCQMLFGYLRLCFRALFSSIHLFIIWQNTIYWEAKWYNIIFLDFELYFFLTPMAFT